ncbi:MAG TPA: nitrogenase cofactor biosynthesis protein NifB, partial [Nitratifractor sp.]|nr:nitrogenase cofactor biosynthesis protein NifB [Nitratifractor sp.]
RGILVKANSVLIPGVNDKELPNVAKKLKEMNVFLHNIMPLLSSPEFGTKFGLDGVPSATDQETMAVQDACGMDMTLMKHCRQCRADAVGLIGEDRGDEFTKESFVNMEFTQLEDMYNIEARTEKHEMIENWRAHLEAANERVKLEEASKAELSSTGETKLVAVTTGGNGLINMHFGSAQEFLIYEAGDKAIKFVMHRKIESSYSGTDSSEDFNPIDEIKVTLGDCDLLLTEKIGECPMSELSEIGLVTDDSYSQQPIEKSVFDAVQKYFFQEEEVELG